MNAPISGIVLPASPSLAAARRVASYAVPTKKNHTRNQFPRILSYLLPFVVTLVLTGGVVLAFSFKDLSADKFSVFRQSTQDSDFQVNDLSLKPKGTNKIDVSVILKNGDTSNAHTATVAVQVLDVLGNLLIESSSQSTGSVAGGATVTLSFQLTQTGLVAAHVSQVVTIDQTS